MSEKPAKISDAELALMKVLWEAGEPLSAQQVSESLQEKDWKYSTVATLFSRLVDKNAVSVEKRGRFYYYTPLISEKEYKAEQTHTPVSYTHLDVYKRQPNASPVKRLFLPRQGFCNV